jgi:hypothetical protein
MSGAAGRSTITLTGTVALENAEAPTVPNHDLGELSVVPSGNL